jgi:hypothetical protein
MLTQLQPVIVKTQASLDDEQAPLHAGASASPHATGRHAQDASPAAAPHFMPEAHCPVHWPLLNVHWPFASVVVVIEPPATVVDVEPPTIVVDVVADGADAGVQSICARPNFTVRVPNWSRRRVASGSGRLHFS